MKRISLLLVLALCFSFMAPFAVSADSVHVTYEVLSEVPERTEGLDCYEVLSNTSFEFLQTPTKILSWAFTSHKGAANTILGDELTEHTTDAHTGDYAIKVRAEENQYIDTLAGVDIKPGETYECSVWFKRISGGFGGDVHLIFSTTEKGATYSFDRPKMNFNTVKAEDGWVQKAIRFVAPEHAQKVSVSLRYKGPGEVIWDDVSLLHITNEMPKPEMPDEKPSLETLTINDASFEEGAKGWELFKNAHVSDEEAHSGKYSLALHNESGVADSEATITVSGLKKGATYQLSAWVLTPGEDALDMGFWIYYSSKDYYDWADVASQLGQEKPRWTMRKSLHWIKYIAEFTPPDDARSVLLDFRHRLSPGPVFLDDVSLYMVKAPYAVKAETDEIFYYTEWPKGELAIEPYVMADPANSKAEISFVELDGSETHKETIVGLGEKKTYSFRTEWMKEKGQRYHIRIRVYDPSGALIQDEKSPVYRYDRPTYLGADGVFRKNGKEYEFTFGAGIRSEYLDFHPESGGVKIVQILADDSRLTTAQKMDMAYEQGLFCLLNLYSGTKSGGHPDQLESTIDLVTEFKDHPALFGWKIHDEPYQKLTDEEEMITAYTTVRNIDPNHPVYFPDSPPGGYEWMFKFTDILDIDYYGGANADAGRIISDVMDKAMAASKGKKPFSIVLQAFPMNGYLPTMDQLRHMTYQSFFSGAFGYTFHSLGIDTHGGNNTVYMSRPEWKDIVEKWAKWERDFMYGCFVTGEYKFLNYQKTEDVMWATYTDGKDIYAIVLNRDIKVVNTAEIPLRDGMGTVKVDAFTAETMTGDKKTASGTGTLSVSVEPYEAVVWKVTPSAPINTSHIRSTSFNDIINYPWAYNAIATLEEKGIANRVSDTWFGPGQNITRGDYAMFLVRTLGLTAGSGNENFMDVAPDAEYAKELAIGKTAGIINGVGDNKFNPEAQITRQDMMTMTSRALKLAGSADLGSFSDAGLIADYAQTHVSAMVAEGLIRGNADGTINPLGNTTRAEAAVIMQRLLNK